MSKQSAKQLQAEAQEAFYGDDMVKVEVCMTELQERFPGTAQRLRARFEEIIFERSEMDDLGVDL